MQPPPEGVPLPEPETPPEVPPVEPPEVEAPPRPSLVVSAEGNYWQVGEVVVVAEGEATFTVDTNARYQDWYGFGGAFNEAGWYALSQLDESERERALELLFDPHEGIGLDWGRIPIGPNDYSLERYTLSDAPGHFAINHDRLYLIPYVKAAQAVKADIQFWATPWTPPPWAKMGATQEGGYDKGSFNPEYYQEYADFFVAWIEAYEAEGIPIDSVMPQQEPGFLESAPSCAFGPTRDVEVHVEINDPITLGTFIDAYLFPSLDAAGLDTRVWLGTLANTSFTSDYWTDVMSKPSADRIAGAGLQWEAVTFVQQAITEGYVVMQTEHKGGNYPFLPTQATSPADADRNNFLPTMAPNNHAYGEESWDLIKSWIDVGVQVYNAWNLVLDSYGWSLNVVRPWPQNAVLAVDTVLGTLQVTPYYYVLRHLGQYVEAGAVRVAVNGDALAFQNPDTSVVAILRTTEPGLQTVAIDGTLLQYESAGNGWVTVVWEGE